MFLYKLKKVLRERKKDIIQSTLSFSLMASVLSLFVFIFINNEDFSKSDKRQMAVTSVILTSINLTIIYFVDYFLGYNIIVTILLGYFSSFLFFFIPCLIFILYFEVTELELDKSETRDAKLNSLFRNLF
jgi:phosphoglycerol transferase MdoB-like AlkP superfamily enzyme